MFHDGKYLEIDLENRVIIKVSTEFSSFNRLLLPYEKGHNFFII